MDSWSKDASERMKIKIDQRVLTDMLPDISALNKGATAGAISGDIDLGTQGAPEALTTTNVIDLIVNMGNIAPDVAATNRGVAAGAQSLAIDLGVASTPNALTTSNVLAEIINHGTVLDEANIPEQDRFMVIPAKMAGLIKQSDVKDASITGDGSTPLRNGRLGMVDRFTLYVSHNLPLSATGAWA